MYLEELREELWRLHMELPKNNLVTWTAGNIRARAPESGFVAIKPSGVKYEDLRPEHMAITNLEGDIIEGNLKPSSDTASLLYIYRHRPEVNGVVHTRSRSATAFAANNMEIPCRLTAQGDGFGDPIPCGDFALNGVETIGRPDVIPQHLVDKPHYRYTNVYGQ